MFFIHFNHKNQQPFIKLSLTQTYYYYRHFVYRAVKFSDSFKCTINCCYSFVSDLWVKFLIFYLLLREEHVHLLAEGLGHLLQQLLDLQRPLERDDSGNEKECRQRSEIRDQRKRFMLRLAAGIIEKTLVCRLKIKIEEFIFWPFCFFLTFYLDHVAQKK